MCNALDCVMELLSLASSASSCVYFCWNKLIMTVYITDMYSNWVWSFLIIDWFFWYKVLILLLGLQIQIQGVFLYNQVLLKHILLLCIYFVGMLVCHGFDQHIHNKYNIIGFMNIIVLLYLQVLVSPITWGR